MEKYKIGSNFQVGTEGTIQSSLPHQSLFELKATVTAMHVLMFEDHTS
jgi:hypothetical protein